MKTKLLDTTLLREGFVEHVLEDAQYVVVFAGASHDGNYSLELIFDKEGVKADVLVFYRIEPSNNLSLTTVARHTVPYTSCDTQVKGVLLSKAKSSYIGKILIEKNAQQTSSFLHDSVMVLGEDTKNNSQPILEIEADDVRASHGASTGRIDENQIYYLTSRGLNRIEAEEIIVDGFFNSLISRISDERAKIKVASELGLDYGTFSEEDK